MKKFTAIVFILAFTLSLTACSKIRDPACYSVQQYGDGWSILYTDEEGVEEIAAILKSKPSTVKSWLYRARQKLKIDLEGETANV